MDRLGATGVRVLAFGIGAGVAGVAALGVATANASSADVPYSPKNCGTGYVVGTQPEYAADFGDSRTPDQVADANRDALVPGQKAKSKKEKPDRAALLGEDPAKVKHYDYYDDRGKAIGTVKLEKQGGSWRVAEGEGCSDTGLVPDAPRSELSDTP